MQLYPYYLVSASLQSEDDIDRLFSKLPELQPSGDLVARILSRVRAVPASSTHAPASQPDWLDLLLESGNGLIARKEKQEPS